MVSYYFGAYLLGFPAIPVPKEVATFQGSLVSSAPDGKMPGSSARGLTLAHR